MSYPAYVLARQFKYQNLSSDFDFSSASWTDITGMSITLAAEVDDVFEVTFSGRLSPDDEIPGGTGTAALDVGLNLKFNGVAVGDATFGVAEEMSHSSVSMMLTTVYYRTIVTADIASGYVTVIPQMRQVSASDTRRLEGGATRWCVKNLGPQDPN